MKSCIFVLSMIISIFGCLDSSENRSPSSDEKWNSLTQTQDDKIVCKDGVCTVKDGATVNPVNPAELIPKKPSGKDEAPCKVVIYSKSKGCPRCEELKKVIEKYSKGCIEYTIVNDTVPPNHKCKMYPIVAIDNEIICDLQTADKTWSEVISKCKCKKCHCAADNKAYCYDTGELYKTVKATDVYLGRPFCKKHDDCRPDGASQISCEPTATEMPKK
jgi:hypothetical protein